MYFLSAAHQIEVIIKKSRFIVTCEPIDSLDSVALALERLRVVDATHNCWAWRLGQAYRFNDDGEPGGSAGRPMLAAIDGLEIDGVLAHVVRYFGGTKLGVGGLVRAYGNGVAQCLREAPKALYVPMETLRFVVDFSDSYAVYGVIAQHELEKLEETFLPTGVEFLLNVELSQVDAVRSALIEQTGGRLVFPEANA